MIDCKDKRAGVEPFDTRIYSPIRTRSYVGRLLYRLHPAATVSTVGGFIPALGGDKTRELFRRPLIFTYTYTACALIKPHSYFPAQVRRPLRREGAIHRRLL